MQVLTLILKELLRYGLWLMKLSTVRALMVCSHLHRLLYRRFLEYQDQLHFLMEQSLMVIMPYQYYSMSFIISILVTEIRVWMIERLMIMLTVFLQRQPSRQWQYWYQALILRELMNMQICLMRVLRRTQLCSGLQMSRKSSMLRMQAVQEILMMTRLIQKQECSLAYMSLVSQAGS